MIATLRNRNFALLWAGGLISMIGNWMLMAALPFYVYDLTGSAFAASGILMAMVAPVVLLGSFAGIFVDRWDRKKIMVVTSALQALTVMGLLFVQSSEWIWVLYVVIFAESSLKTFFGPAEGALLPNLVSEKHLVSANSLNALNDNLARIVGPMIGGLLLGNLGFSSVIWADMLSYIVAMGLIMMISAENTSPAKKLVTSASEQLSQWKKFWQEWLGGLRYVRSRQILMGLFVIMGFAMFGDAILSAILVVFFQDELGLGAVEFGWLMTARGLGGLLGGLIIAQYGKKLSPTQLISFGLTASGVLIGVLLLRPALPLILFFMVLAGPALMAWIISMQSIVQMEAEDAFRGRVFGAIGTTNTLIMFFGSAITGMLADQTGSMLLVGASAGIFILAGLIAPAIFGKRWQAAAAGAVEAG